MTCVIAELEWRLTGEDYFELLNPCSQLKPAWRSMMVSTVKHVKISDISLPSGPGHFAFWPAWHHLHMLPSGCVQRTIFVCDLELTFSSILKCFRQRNALNKTWTWKSSKYTVCVNSTAFNSWFLLNPFYLQFKGAICKKKWPLSNKWQEFNSVIVNYCQKTYNIHIAP